jgi:hypothetical protein
MPIGEVTVQSSKGETGHGPWLEWAIDFLACCETAEDRGVLDRVYLCSVSDTRKQRTADEYQTIRRFWKRVRRCKLDGHGMRIFEKMINC